MQGPEYKQAQLNHSSLLSVVAKMLGDEVKPINATIRHDDHESLMLIVVSSGGYG